MEKKLIRIKNTELNFSIKNEKQSILDTAINENIILPYGCKSGACGSCITKLIKGSILTLDEKSVSKNDSILLCQALPNSKEIILEYTSDKLDIIKEKNNNSSEIYPKEFPLQVVGNKSVTPMVKELSFFIPTKFNFKFLPGSHMELFDKERKISRKYSIINSPNQLMNLKRNIIKFLVVNHNKDGLSDTIHNKINPGDILSLKGPYSTFYYKIKKDDPVIAIAGGTGISPILSIVKNLLEKNNTLNVLVYLSVRTRNEILEMDTFLRLKEKYKNFSFKITLSRELGFSNSLFLNGRVDTTLKKVFKDLSTHKILIAGSDGFVETAIINAVKLKALKKNIFYEKFSKN